MPVAKVGAEQNANTGYARRRRRDTAVDGGSIPPISTTGHHHALCECTPTEPIEVAVRTLLNIIWLVLSGFWLFLGYAFAALLMFLFIVTIPWGIAAWRIGVYSLWPFGKEVVDRPTAGVGSAGALRARMSSAAAWPNTRHSSSEFEAMRLAPRRPDCETSPIA